MNIATRLFVSSMIFAIGIAAAYGSTTHDLVGSILLIMMAIAMIVVAGYIVVAEKEANLAGDVVQAEARNYAGEELGVFSLESYWPIIGALGTVLLLLGIVFLPGPSAVTALVAGGILYFVILFLLRESK